MESCSDIWSPISTLIVGGAAIYVSVLQYRINQQKLKLDLYDRRIRIYELVKTFLQTVISNATISPSELSEFWFSASQADFLFESEILKYINEIHKHGVRLNYFNTTYRDMNQSVPPGYDHNATVEGRYQELTWFSEQFEPARGKFQKYLTLKV